MGIDLFCPVTPATPSFEIVSQAVYIQGRYLKLVRGLSQTPWYVGSRSAHHVTMLMSLIMTKSI